MTRFIFIISFCLVVLACSNPATILIDGSVQSRKQLNKLRSPEIFLYERWPPGEAPSRYQEWNKSTLIVVITKKAERRYQQERYVLLNSFLDSVEKGTAILLVLNGVAIDPSAQTALRKLYAGQLSNAETVEWQTARKIYGSMAKPITLTVNTYDPKYNIWSQNTKP